MNHIGLLILRVVPALFMALGHGLPKLQGYSTMSASFPDPIGLGSNVSLLLTIFGELLCTALLAMGLFTRVASLPPLITMLVAGFVIHGSDPFGKKEFALLYACVFLAVALLGPGKWSLDYRLRHKL